MKLNIIFLIAILFAVITSCTLDKTDFESEIDRDVTKFYKFEEVTSFNSSKFKITIEALNGTFYKGYNELRIKIINTQTQQFLNNSEVTFLPILTTLDNDKTSCPHKYRLDYKANENYYSGYVVFTSVSNSMENWNLFISFKDNNQLYTVRQFVTIENQTNKNLSMTSFEGSDGEQYFIALVAPQKPKVAENRLVAGIYKYDQLIEFSETFPDPLQFSYSEPEDYILLLDPRMPEPSMGNHSSPNNVDLTQQEDGFYHGVVNYTMTGNWTLNFIMLNHKKEIIKGTEVSTEFTPGIQGTKSELFIDILF